MSEQHVTQAGQPEPKTTENQQYLAKISTRPSTAADLREVARVVFPANKDLDALPLYIDVHEDTEIYTPMSSRIAHLVMIDVLAVGVAKSRGPRLAEQLKSVKKSLNSLRYPEPDEDQN